MRRPRPSRVRRVGKWAGVVVTMLVVGVWIASGWWGAGFWHFQGADTHRMGIGGGSIVLGHDSTPGARFATNNAWHLTRLDGFRMRWSFDWSRRLLSHGLISAYVVVPLWTLAMPLVAGTAFLWWRDARVHKSGCCLRCGYDLTGINGACPECGADAEALPRKPTR